MPGPRSRLSSPLKPNRACRSRCHAAGQPYQQGQLDGLCGIYSAVNALSLLLACGKPLSSQRCAELFQAGLAFVGAETPLDGVVAHGMDPELWFAMLQSLSKEAARDMGVQLAVERPLADRPHAGARLIRETIETALDANAVVLVSLGGAHNHYTVVQAHSPTRFVLHDSSGLRWLAKAACGSGRARSRHQIAGEWVIMLNIQDAPGALFEHEQTKNQRGRQGSFGT